MLFDPIFDCAAIDSFFFFEKGGRENSGKLRAYKQKTKEAHMKLFEHDHIRKPN